MMKPPRSRLPLKEKNTNLVRGRSQEMEPMKVYCRIRPLPEPCDTSWLSMISNSVLAVTNPDPLRNQPTKALHFTFKQIFDDSTSQKSVFDTVALPLVQNVLQGKNGLLFTYGVTGSGKTYTMSGNSRDGGIMPRCLDVIFNSISEYQAKKHVFKPDKLNGFEIQSEVDAVLEKHNELVNLISNVKSSKHKLLKKDSDPDLAQRIVDPTKLECIDDENSYAVFVTLIEIYNNNVFDLLDDIMDDIRPRNLQSKIIREDSSHNMFVHGVTEVEVTTTEEAFEVFCRGQKRKRTAHTNLNAESSRSHTVFTIRVVQAALDSEGENVHLSRLPVIVGQLSLVDLAGSERTNRTNNTGMRLREAGNINNSLMTLRTCLELLRENQTGANKVIPYRESRLTHLFKTFFEGEGQVSMIVCLNPHYNNYDESLHVLKFAEMSQEVQIACPTPLKPLSAYTPGRRKAQQAFRSAIKKLEASDGTSEEECQSGEHKRSRKKLNLNDSPLLGFPIRKEGLEGDIMYTKEIVVFTEARLKALMENRNKENVEKFREQLLQHLKEGNLATEELKATKVMYDQEKEKATILEKKKSSLEIEVNILKRKLEDNERDVKKLKTEMSEKDLIINKKTAEKDRAKERYMHRAAAFEEKSRKIERQKTEMEMEIRNKNKKLRQVQKVLSDECISLSSTPSVASTRSKFETPTSYVPTPRPVTADRPNPAERPTPRRGVPVVNRRHRRSRSVGEVWLEHRPTMPVPLNTVMQPTMKKRKSVNKLTDAKDVTETSKYCLMTQNQDSDGDLETRLYKGDVIPTAGGGAQVMFNDVEVLKQVSPNSSPKRKLEYNLRDPQPSCSIAYEGHRLRSRRH